MKSAAACNVMQVGHRKGDQKKEQWERGSVGQGAVQKGAVKEVTVSHSTCIMFSQLLQSFLSTQKDVTGSGTFRLR